MRILMSPGSISKNKTDEETKQEDDLSSYKFILGDFGIQILAAIAKGANTRNSIMTLSGVPMACVKGRTPVLQNLNLISKIGLNNYVITKKGVKFLKLMQKSKDSDKL